MIQRFKKSVLHYREKKSEKKKHNKINILKEIKKKQGNEKK